jgi:D-alanyl-lipoteichoic acid acyltransferase DltB (MBOAT superfamily)
MQRESKATRRKLWIWTSVSVNLGILALFKYYNFFIENFISVFTFFGTNFTAPTLNIVLPVGISFYTFQTLTYTLDVYRGRIKATSDFVAFSAFVTFFPQLVAGPIERAENLLPQFFQPKTFDYTKAVEGLRQILWGLFKKVVIADNCADLVNLIFDNSPAYSGSTLFLGAVFFAFQIYGDFSGYSDIALGTSRLFGFELMRNFAYPYFSRDIAEFWRRWHISLSTLFRDYLYIPLGGSKGTISRQIRNVMIIFLVSGFWHGANWTFLAWGAVNALLFIPLMVFGQNRKHTDIVASGRLLPTASDAGRIGITFLVTTLAWIFFRAETFGHAMQILREIFSPTLFSVPKFGGLGMAMLTLGLIMIFMIVEWLGRENEFAISGARTVRSSMLRYSYYYVIIASIMIFGNFNENEFIYFQF